MALVVALSALYESLFLHRGLNAMDEGWPLYAAMQLHAGGELYRDVFWVFPPGHALAAWVAYALAPPGLYLARLFYAGFDVALCVVLYLLGRRITSPGFAWLGASLAAVAAPDSHAAQLIFGYRYLVWSAAALWCFGERLRTGSPRWTAAAGALCGVALAFRIDPPAAAGLGIAAGLLAARPGWAALRRDAVAFALGFAAAAGPLLGWLLWRVGAGTLWLEVVVRPIEMTRLQSLPLPSLALPARLGPWALRRWFVALQFRLWLLLYAGYLAALGVAFARALARRRPLGQPLLLAVVVWGAVFYSRSFGRSDEPHLDSALPPALLLLGHALGLAAARLPSAASRGALGAAVFAAWVWVTAVPRYPGYLDRGAVPVASLGGATWFLPRSSLWPAFDELVAEIRRETGPDDVVFDLTASPLLQVAAGRRGPGWADLVMPGTFLDASEENAMIERLERRPPALVLVSRTPFDRKVERSPLGHAPRLWAWIQARYAVRRVIGRFVLLAPLDPQVGGLGPAQRAVDSSSRVVISASSRNW